MNEEHNPDYLSKEQYGAPEWRLLRVGETPDVGDDAILSRHAQWSPIERRYNGPINEAFLCTYRRRVSPTIADQSARIAELERENARLTASLLAARVRIAADAERLLRSHEALNEEKLKHETN